MEKTYFKMYKAGKHWLVAGVALAGTVVVMGATNAHADETINVASVAETVKNGPVTDVQPASAADLQISSTNQASGAASQAATLAEVAQTPTSTVNEIQPNSSVATSSAAIAPNIANNSVSSMAPNTSPTLVASAAPTTNIGHTSAASVANISSKARIKAAGAANPITSDAPTKSDAPADPITSDAPTKSDALADPITSDAPTKSDAPADPIISDIKHVSNMFVTPNSRFAAYGSEAKLNLSIYSQQATQYLANMYIVLPKGIDIVGSTPDERLQNLNDALQKYVGGLPIVGKLTGKQLQDSTNGNKVYEIKPDDKTYIVGNGNQSDDPTKVMVLPITLPAQDNTTTSTILLNANILDTIAQNVLFIGAGDGKNVKFDTSVAAYPTVDSTQIGINDADDTVLRGIVLNGIQKSITLFNPTISDTINVKANNAPASSVKSITVSGQNDYTYTLDDIKRWINKNNLIESSIMVNGFLLNEVKDFKRFASDGFATDETTPLVGHTFTITYDLQAVPVTVHYQDTNNKSLADDVVINGIDGASYTTTPATVDGYQLKTTPDNATGTFGDSSQTVTYVYDKIAAPVTVHYQDTNDKSLADDVVIKGIVGDPYQTQQRDISGYVLTKVDGNAKGKLGDEPITITYFYEKIPDAGNPTPAPITAAPVTVHYQDSNGNKLADDQILTGNFADSYSTTAQTIAGYTFSKVIGNPSGILLLNPQNVTYVYTKDIPPVVVAAPVTVHYQDATGQTLAPDITINGNVGDAYSTSQQAIAGYTFTNTSGNPIGTLSANNQTVTYVYTKDVTPTPKPDPTPDPTPTPQKQGQPVLIHFVNAEGKAIADSQILTGNLGTGFSVNPPLIAGYQARIIDNYDLNGVFTDAPQTITVVYDQIDVPQPNNNQSGNHTIPKPTPKPNQNSTVHQPVNGKQKPVVNNHQNTKATAFNGQTPMLKLTDNMVNEIPSAKQKLAIAPTTSVATLPKTDQKTNQVGVIAGLLGIMVTGLGVLGIKRSRRED